MNPFRSRGPSSSASVWRCSRLVVGVVAALAAVAVGHRRHRSCCSCGSRHRHRHPSRSRCSCGRPVSSSFLQLASSSLLFLLQLWQPASSSSPSFLQVLEQAGVIITSGRAYAGGWRHRRRSCRCCSKPASLSSSFLLIAKQAAADLMATSVVLVAKNALALVVGVGVMASAVPASAHRRYRSLLRLPLHPSCGFWRRCHRRRCFCGSQSSLSSCLLPLQQHVVVVVIDAG